MSYDVGLHVNSASWAISEEEKKRRKRLWWGVYMQDKWWALCLGRPSYLQTNQSNVPMVSPSDFPVSDDISANTRELRILAARIFIAMAELTVILSDVLSEFYTVTATTAIEASSEEAIVEKVNGFSMRIDSWKALNGPIFEHWNGIPDPTGIHHLMPGPL